MKPLEIALLVGAGYLLLKGFKPATATNEAKTPGVEWTSPTGQQYGVYTDALGQGYSGKIPTLPSPQILTTISPPASSVSILSTSPKVSTPSGGGGGGTSTFERIISTSSSSLQSTAKKAIPLVTKSSPITSSFVNTALKILNPQSQSLATGFSSR